MERIASRRQMRNWRSAMLMIAASTLFASVEACAKTVVIHAGRLIDGRSPQPLERMSIRIENDRIVSVEKGFVSPDGAEIIDLSDHMVLPGLIEAHDHISAGKTFFDPLSKFYGTGGEGVVNAILNARTELGWGFTTVRDLGDVGSGLSGGPTARKAIEDDRIVGPRLWTAMQPLGPLGGHSDRNNGLLPGIAMPDSEASIVSGPESARNQVRLHLRRGASVIKIMPSGGATSVNDNPDHMTMTDEEMRTIVETAHELGLKVAAHAHSKKAIDHAVMAGVDSIEHGSDGDAETFRLMRERGTFVVPTLLITDILYQTALHHPEQLPPTVADKVLNGSKRKVAKIGEYYRAGVKIAFGTDVSAGGDRLKAEEFVMLLAAGMTPMDAIFTATRNAAELIGRPQDIGSIQAGRYADIIAVKGDPLADITELQRVRFVMKGGEIVKRDGAMLR